MNAGPDDKAVPRWQGVAAAVYLFALVAEVVVFRSRLHADFIPFDTSHVAPNILASLIIVEVLTPFGVLIWPPTRRRIHRFMDSKLAAHAAAMHARHDALEQSHAELHAKLDRVLEHLDIDAKEKP